MEKIYCNYDEECEKYPGAESIWAPSIRYPEYPFVDVSEEDNRVYQMIREGFLCLKMDKTHYGTAQWNPLGDFIKPGMVVLLKPNWVMHENPEPRYHDMECLVTHPSIIRVMIDYVVIALKGTGEIILGDAPMAQCHFDDLYHIMNYDILVDFYKKQHVNIKIVDMRGTTFDDNKNKLSYNKIEKKGNDKDEIIVNLGSISAFSDLSKKVIKNLRSPKFAPNLTQIHHTSEKHEYGIHRKILNADVIINLPKLKSHRKAGMTACCKNFIGANMKKEYLPHVTYGAINENGDAYEKKNIILSLSNKANDKYYNLASKDKELSILYRVIKGLLRRIGVRLTKEIYWDGSWYGNDTIWRTIADVCNAVYYADKNGKIKRDKQRIIFSVCDMIISGENEGPLQPTPKKLHTIIMGGCHIASMDAFICKYIGFDESYIKNIPFLMKQEGLKKENIQIITSRLNYNMNSFPFSDKTRLIACYGWHGFIDVCKS